MQLGTFKIPDIRLNIIISETLKKIYESVKTDEIKSKDLSELLDYKFGTEPALFKKINSMLSYGLLEGRRGVYKITTLGEDILFPEPDKEQHLKTQAILNVKLWDELFKKNKKELPKNGLWVQLKNITGADPDTAKKAEKKILAWYEIDIELVSEDLALIKENRDQPPKYIRSSSTQDNQMSQQMESSKLNNSADVEILSFDKYQVLLPKGDLKIEWDKLKKYMDIKLEDYVYEKLEIKSEGLDKESQVVVTEIEDTGD